MQMKNATTGSSKCADRFDRYGYLLDQTGATETRDIGFDEPITKPWELDEFCLKDYLKNRANGEEKDSPDWPFPGDGTYEWETPDEKISYRLYSEGPKDREWMEERDQRYIDRIARKDEADLTEVERRDFEEVNSNNDEVVPMDVSP